MTSTPLATDAPRGAAEAAAQRADAVLAKVRATVASGNGITGAEVDALAEGELAAWGEALGRVRREVEVALARVAHRQATLSRAKQPAHGMARRRGEATPEHLVAGQTGASEFDARRLMEVGRSLADAEEQDDEAPPGRSDAQPQPSETPGDQPASPRFAHVSAAVEGAEIGVEAAAMITRMLRAVHDHVEPHVLEQEERTLVAKARVLRVGQLARVVRRTESRLRSSALEQEESQRRASRFLHVTEDRSGMIVVNGRLDPETAAPVKAALDAVVAQGLQARRDKNTLTTDDRSVPQMRADGLAMLARHALKCDNELLPLPGGAVVVRIAQADVQVALDARGRGERVGEGTAEIDGISQTITAGAARRIAAESGVLPVVLGGDSAVLDFGTGRRPFSRAQKLALIERDGGCAMCGAPPSWCQAHHIREWVAHGGATDLANGVMLCTRCHHDVHAQGWRVDATSTEVWFTPPPSIDPARRRRPGGRMLHDGRALDPEQIGTLDEATRNARGSTPSQPGGGVLDVAHGSGAGGVGHDGGARDAAHSNDARDSGSGRRVRDDAGQGIRPSDDAGHGIDAAVKPAMRDASPRSTPSAGTSDGQGTLALCAPSSQVAVCPLPRHDEGARRPRHRRQPPVTAAAGS